MQADPGGPIPGVTRYLNGEFCEKEVCVLMRRMVLKDPSARPSAKEVHHVVASI